MAAKKKKDTSRSPRSAQRTNKDETNTKYENEVFGVHILSPSDMEKHFGNAGDDAALKKSRGETK